MPREAPSLQRRLLVRLLVPLSVLFLTGGTVGYFVADTLSNRVYDRELLEIAHELSLHLVDRGGTVALNLSPGAERLLLLDQYDTVAYRVTTGDGRTIAGDPALPLPAQAAKGAAGPQFYRGKSRGRPMWIVAAHAMVPDTETPSGVLVQVAETGRKRDTLAWEILISIVVPQLLLIVMAGLLLRFGVIEGLLPLRRLRQAVADRSHLDLSPIVASGVPGEVKPLVDAVNELMLRLSEVLSLQNRFIADAAHQLRTPVAGLKANIEVALRETDPALMRRSLAQVYVSVERLSRLVSQLLSLARNEPHSVRSLNFTVVDLGRLIFNVTMEWVPEAYKKEIDLGFEGPEGSVAIDGDPVRLKELASNLLDNAIRYSREGGRVTVRVSNDPRPTVSISDDGPRIPPEERERIFERFHRLLGSQADGSGLGLAIVREIATMHGAQVTLTDDADGIGNRFSVAFPAIGPRAIQGGGPA